MTALLVVGLVVVACCLPAVYRAGVKSAERRPMHYPTRFDKSFDKHAEEAVRNVREWRE